MGQIAGKMPTLPQAIASVIVTFASLFAKRVFAHVKLLLVGALLVLGVLGLVQGNQYTLEPEPSQRSPLQPGCKEVRSCTIPMKHTTISIFQR